LGTSSIVVTAIRLLARSGRLSVVCFSVAIIT